MKMKAETGIWRGEGTLHSTKKIKATKILFRTWRKLWNDYGMTVNNDDATDTIPSLEDMTKVDLGSYTSEGGRTKAGRECFRVEQKFVEG